MNFSAGITVHRQEQTLKCELKRSVMAGMICNGLHRIEAWERIGQTYMLCQKTQVACAQLALYGRLPDTSMKKAMALEIVEQTLWRWLVDLPRVTGVSDLKDDFTELRRHLKTWQQAYSDDDVSAGARQPHTHDLLLMSERINELLGVPVTKLADFSSAQLQDWLDSSPGLAAQIIRRADLPVRLPNRLLSSASFEAHALTWLSTGLKPQGETCAFAEYSGRPPLQALQDTLAPLQQRLLARLLLLSETYQQLVIDDLQPVVGMMSQGRFRVAWVMTVRGLLVHRVEFSPQDPDIVRDYEILAPTDLNFGRIDLSRCFSSVNTDLVQGSRLQQAIELLLLTLDPCVDYQLELKPAQ